MGLRAPNLIRDAAKPGTRSALTVYRRGQARDLNITIAELEPDQAARRPAARGSEPAKPLDLDVSGVRRLTILVDFGENLDTADHLDLAEARLVK